MGERGEGRLWLGVYVNIGLGTWEPPTNLDLKPYLVGLESLMLTTLSQF